MNGRVVGRLAGTLARWLTGWKDRWMAGVCYRLPVTGTVVLWCAASLCGNCWFTFTARSSSTCQQRVCVGCGCNIKLYIVNKTNIPTCNTQYTHIHMWCTCRIWVPCNNNNYMHSVVSSCHIHNCGFRVMPKYSAVQLVSATVWHWLSFRMPLQHLSLSKATVMAVQVVAHWCCCCFRCAVAGICCNCGCYYKVE